MNCLIAFLEQKTRYFANEGKGLARRKAYIYNAETPAKGLLFKKLGDTFLIGGTLVYSSVFGFCCVTMQIIEFTLLNVRITTSR